jgi:glycosyltransferase 2 family protein
LKKNILATLKFTLFLSIGIGLLWLVLRGLDFDEIIMQIKTAKYQWIILAFVPALIAHWSRAVRWNIMINSMGYKTTLFSTFHATIMGYFANAIFPRLGEVTRCTVLSRKQNIPLNSLFGTVISERVFDLICLFFISFIVIITQFSFLREFLDKMVWLPLTSRLPSSTWLITVLGISILLAMILFLILLKISMPLIRKLSFYRKLKDLLLGFISGIKTIRYLKQRNAFLSHTVLIWSMYFLMSYLPFKALHATEHLNLIDGTTMLMMGSFAMVIPVPAGIGAYHWVITKTLTDLYAIASEPAASYAMIVHASQLLFVGALGTISFITVLIWKTKPKNVKIRDR